MSRLTGVLMVCAVCPTLMVAGCDHAPPQEPPESLPPSAYTEDFDAAWSFVLDTYAYFDDKAVDWEQVRNVLRPRVAEIRDHDGFVGLLEELIEHLYDHHAHLGTNTPSSPRLVPSGADLWAAHADGVALITQVRDDSAAEGSGLRAGMEVLSIDGLAVATAVDERLPPAVDRHDASARDWALRVLLAGRHGTPVRLAVRAGADRQDVTFEPGQWNRPDTPLTVTFRHDARVGHVRLNNSLGEAALIPAWDAALDASEGYLRTHPRSSRHA